VIPMDLSARSERCPADPKARPPRRPLPPWLAEIEERLRSRPSLWETLREEDLEFLRNYDSPEVLGPPPPPPPPMKRRPRGRGDI